MKTAKLPKKARRMGPLPASKLILVPIDFSEHSLRALRRGSDLAIEKGGSVCAVFIIERPVFSADLANIPLLPSEDSIVTSARQKLLASVSTEVDASVRSYAKVLIGKPYAEICSLAAELKADLIVMSSHGYTGFKHALLGSVAEKVIQHAPCDVLVIKHQSQGPASSRGR